MAVQAQLYAENLVFPLGGSQDLLLMENAGGFNESSFNVQQLQQQQQQRMQFMQLQNNMQQNRNRTCSFDKNVLRPENNPSMVFDQSLDPRMKKQRLDIDPLISLHSERLRIAFQEHRRQQAILLKKYESEAQIILGQKDEEIAEAANRTRVLNDFLQRMESENQAWQRLAKEKEAIIVTLNHTLNQLRENACQTRNGVDDEESCCDIIINNPTTAETVTVKRTVAGHESEHNTRKMICKICNNSRNPCVIILLPCRHLCSCKFCEPYIHSCPVCNMPKKGIIEALL